MEERAFFERRVGTLLRGKWTLERLLGVGGMAAVYVGVHKIGRRDAIKILHPDIARSKDLRDRFEQEAHAVNLFKHPGAVEIRDIDTSEDGAPFLVMELLEGESLSERARRQDGIDSAEMLRLVDELLDVLAAAHAQGIVHRDIKLDNLFFQKDGRLKVLDFGIARMRTGAPRALLTRTGATLGTVAYMPPEQVKGTEIDHRADLFAVGATMYRLVAKRRIHESRSESELLVKMATEPAAPLASVAPSAPEGVCHVVDRALAFHRARRYPDAATMQGDVRALRSGAVPPYATARLAEGDQPGSKEAPTGADPVSSAFGAPSAFRDAATAVPGSVLRPAGSSLSPVDPTAATSRAGVELSLDTPPPAGRRTGSNEPTVAAPSARSASAPNLPAVQDGAARSPSGQHPAAMSQGWSGPPSHHTPPPPSMQNPPMLGVPAISTPMPTPSTATPGVAAPASSLESTLKSGAVPGPSSFGHSPTSPSAVLPAPTAHDSSRPAKGGTVAMVVQPSAHGSDRPLPMGATMPVAGGVVAPQRKRESATPLIVMGAVFLLAGIAVGIWFGLRGGGEAASVEAAASAAAPPIEPAGDPAQASSSTTAAAAGATARPTASVKGRAPTAPTTGAAAPPNPTQTPASSPAPPTTRPTTLSPSPKAPSTPPAPPPGKGKGKDKHEDKKDR